ncbi:ATP-binding protein [Sinomonas cellulolyticus]|uniref:ATP-binding protein n=1 Tax=Sinomonas cellulolyticus TaxID=2801916 RepID=A0ABS1K0T5_9MICC|nr:MULTISPECIES: ATP-binding protein [Sinomonas]MBL0705083.1 ATP-binding protein [Sinomonas cellulolyticus]
MANELGGRGLFIDLHSLCEQALGILRSRDDFDEMIQEYESLGPDADRRSDVERIVGRDYLQLAWYALEIEPGDPATEERFRWGSDQTLIPYFEVEYRNIVYSSKGMGLGEFSVHFLFWILEQYREMRDLTLLIDEPDAYLPPAASFALLARLQRICLDRNWRMVLTTHSGEVIDRAQKESALIVLSTDATGGIKATYSRDDLTAADGLLGRSAVRYELFVEDESAYYLARALIAILGYGIAQTFSLVWGGGNGYMVALQGSLPAPARPLIKHAYLFDGDQRSRVGDSPTRRWPALFLPTEADPDTLFKEAGRDTERLAIRLGVSESSLIREIESHEGKDAHDWVNDVAARFGRPVFLQAISELWVEQNPETVEAFLSGFKLALDC